MKTETARSSVASFRAVTLTSTMCKLMERIKARRVRDCDEDKLRPQRAGTKPKRSTLDTLMQVTRAVRRRKGGGKTQAVFIDYARAFFSVDHGCIVAGLLSFAV
ncbi:putative Reverse transcriptase (RNA dependent DNA polymerase) [Trypanosoma vivax]|nr:putative Reverse transcriptase (RNA dependent DNA polymerase) [Trypanosoma vivax]